MNRCQLLNATSLPRALRLEAPQRGTALYALIPDGGKDTAAGSRIVIAVRQVRRRHEVVKIDDPSAPRTHPWE